MAAAPEGYSLDWLRESEAGWRPNGKPKGAPWCRLIVRDVAVLVLLRDHVILMNSFVS